MSSLMLDKRRHTNRENVQPVKQIFAELTRRGRRFEIDVRRRDHAHVRLDRLRAAERIVLPRLQQLEQLRLRRRRELADLVEEQRAALRRRQLALDPPYSGRMSALRCSEQLALDQRLGNRGAVEFDERLRRARAVVVNDPSDLTLSGPGLARDQHVDVQRRDQRHLTKHLSHGHASPDDRLHLEGGSPGKGRVGPLRHDPPRQESVRVRVDVTGKLFNTSALFLGERTWSTAPVEIDNPQRLTPDRSADHGLNLPIPDASPPLETTVLKGGSRCDRLTGANSFGDDAGIYFDVSTCA